MSFRMRGVMLAFAAMTDAFKRVVVGMSGGVDSTVAVSRLLREGYEVIGVTLRMWTDACQGDEDRKSTRLTPVTMLSRMPSSA